jgi:hypothetical protein
MVAQPIAAVSTASGTTKTADVDVRRLRTLTVFYKLAGTVTAADLTVNDPTPFDLTGAVMTAGLPPELTIAPASDGVNVVAVRRYDVAGVERVRVSAKNNNAGALALTVDVFASAEGRS